MRRASWKFISVKFFLFKTIGKVCAPADSRVWLRLRPLRYALNIQNQEFAESDCVTPLMICVRSSFDSGRGLCPSAKDASEGFRVCLSGVLQNTVPAGRFATTFMKGLSKVFIGRHNRERAQ